MDRQEVADCVRLFFIIFIAILIGPFRGAVEAAKAELARQENAAADRSYRL